LPPIRLFISTSPQQSVATRQGRRKEVLMKKYLFAIIATFALAAALPSLALARGGHHRSHHRSHVRHSVVRHRQFGRDTSTQSSGSSGGGDHAGTVQSFSGGVLTITLNNGSTVSGQVTSATEMECEGAEANDVRGMERDSSGDHGSDNSGEDQSSDDSAEDQSGSDDNQAAAACPASPAQGELVREAELKITSAGSTWEKLDLEPAPQG
jgi:hypothetical protein